MTGGKSFDRNAPQVWERNCCGKARRSSPIPLRAVADVIEVIANVVLGRTFLWAGAAKLLDGPLWMRQAADMGVPRPIAFPSRTSSSCSGLLLVSQLFSPWPAVVAGVMLLAFTVVIVRADSATALGRRAPASGRGRSGRSVPCTSCGTLVSSQSRRVAIAAADLEAV